MKFIRARRRTGVACSPVEGQIYFLDAPSRSGIRATRKSSQWCALNATCPNSNSRIRHDRSTCSGHTHSRRPLQSPSSVCRCLDYSRVDHSLRSACIGSVLAALRAGITAATSAANPRSRVAPANSNGFHGVSSKSWLDMRYPVPVAARIPIRNPMPTCQKTPRKTIAVTECKPAFALVNTRRHFVTYRIVNPKISSGAD